MHTDYLRWCVDIKNGWTFNLMFRVNILKCVYMVGPNLQLKRSNHLNSLKDLNTSIACRIRGHTITVATASIDKHSSDAPTFETHILRNARGFKTIILSVYDDF